MSTLSKTSKRKLGDTLEEFKRKVDESQQHEIGRAADTQPQADEDTEFNHEYNPSSDPLEYEAMVSASVAISTSIDKHRLGRAVKRKASRLLIRRAQNRRKGREQAGGLDDSIRWSPSSGGANMALKMAKQSTRAVGNTGAPLTRVHTQRTALRQW